MNIPVPVIEVVNKLHSAGYEAYLAGGCVRDMFWKLEPNDYDVVTTAKEEDIKKIFDKVLSVGAKFGVFVVLYKGMSFEIAQFRADGEYVKGKLEDVKIIDDVSLFSIYKETI